MEAVCAFKQDYNLSLAHVGQRGVARRILDVERLSADATIVPVDPDLVFLLLDLDYFMLHVRVLL